MDAARNDEQLIALTSMSLKQKGLIVAFSVDTQQGEEVRRLGLVPGEQFEVVGLPPSGDTVEIKIRGYFLSLPKSEAGRIRVRLL